MESKATKIDALLRIALALVGCIDNAMDRLLSLLPRPGPVQAPGIATPESRSPRPEDIVIQRALDEVLEYHRAHRPKNTTKNYEPKQKGWRVGLTSLIVITGTNGSRPGVGRWALRRGVDISQEIMLTKGSSSSSLKMK
jgi:hypothetical protein